jgi:hypothetical protein
MNNDEQDPVDEIRAIRKVVMRKYKTVDAYFEHLKTIPTAEVLLAKIRKKNEAKIVKNPKRGPSGTKAHPISSGMRFS